ncbi:hypothetical protein [Paraburkholderia tropica]|uniref:hypothetical protein n=1 Tax=Paraburkholderia tropica TaxID=92647 RepID=UPI0007EDC343|nr:hypothetical protein [Paraburkholderia tropica]OBR53752.1 hypothetical protein A6456_12525 [Paraburkholderia tropica]
MASSLDVLTALYPGTAVLDVDQIAAALGKNGKAGAQSVRNQLARGTFPIPGRKVGSSWVWSIATVADWLDGIAPDAKPAPSASTASRSAPPSPPPKRRGRPTNAERLRRQQGLSFSAMVSDALDRWLVAEQQRQAATLGDAADQAIDEPLPVYKRKRLGEPDAE